MKETGKSSLSSPRTQDFILRDIVERGWGYDAVLVAYEIGLFSALAKRSKELNELCADLKIAERPLKMLLQICLSLDLIEKTNDSYKLTQQSKDYLVAKSPFFFGKMFDFAIEAKKSYYTYEKLKQAVLDNSPKVYGGEDWTEKHESGEMEARKFTEVMQTHSFAAANHWTKIIDLKRHKTFLDVGGGSAVHSIAAVSANPNLRAIIFELPTVCEIAAEYIEAEDLSGRINLHKGDIWKDDFPKADIHFYSDVFHDWLPENCCKLAQKSFDSMPSGGKIILHEMLLGETESSPSLTVASASLSMLLWTQGQQFSGEGLKEILAGAGFAEIKITPSFGYWSIIEGSKR
jgi:predicted nicotinamide N-methyase